MKYIPLSELTNKYPNVSYYSTSGSNIILSGLYHPNKINFDITNISGITPVENTSFRFIVKVHNSGSDTKYFTSSPYYDDLKLSISDNNPYFTNEAIEQYQIVGVDITNDIEKFQNCHATESLNYIDVSKNTYIISGSNGISVDYNSLIKYIDWIVSDVSNNQMDTDGVLLWDNDPVMDLIKYETTEPVYENPKVISLNYYLNDITNYAKSGIVYWSSTYKNMLQLQWPPVGILPPEQYWVNLPVITFQNNSGNKISIKPSLHNTVNRFFKLSTDNIELLPYTEATVTLIDSTGVNNQLINSLEPIISSAGLDILGELGIESFGLIGINIDKDYEYRGVVKLDITENSSTTTKTIPLTLQKQSGDTWADYNLKVVGDYSEDIVGMPVDYIYSKSIGGITLNIFKNDTNRDGMVYWSKRADLDLRFSNELSLWKQGMFSEIVNDNPYEVYIDAELNGTITDSFSEVTPYSVKIPASSSLYINLLNPNNDIIRTKYPNDKELLYLKDVEYRGVLRMKITEAIKNNSYYNPKVPNSNILDIPISLQKQSGIKYNPNPIVYGNYEYTHPYSSSMNGVVITVNNINDIDGDGLLYWSRTKFKNTPEYAYKWVNGPSVTIENTTDNSVELKPVLNGAFGNAFYIDDEIIKLAPKEKIIFDKISDDKLEVDKLSPKNDGFLGAFNKDTAYYGSLKFMFNGVSGINIPMILQKQGGTEWGNEGINIIGNPISDTYEKAENGVIVSIPDIQDSINGLVYWTQNRIGNDYYEWKNGPAINIYNSTDYNLEVTPTFIYDNDISKVFTINDKFIVSAGEYFNSYIITPNNSLIEKLKPSGLFDKDRLYKNTIRLHCVGGTHPRYGEQLIMDFYINITIKKQNNATFSSSPEIIGQWYFPILPKPDDPNLPKPYISSLNN